MGAKKVSLDSLERAHKWMWDAESDIRAKVSDREVGVRSCFGPLGSIPPREPNHSGAP